MNDSFFPPAEIMALIIGQIGRGIGPGVKVQNDSRPQQSSVKQKPKLKIIKDGKK